MRSGRSCGRFLLLEVSLYEENACDSGGSFGILRRTIGSSTGQFWNPVAIPIPFLESFGLFRARVLRQLRPRGLFTIVLQLSQCRLLRVFERLRSQYVRARLSQVLLRQRLLSALLASGLLQRLLSARLLRPALLLSLRAVRANCWNGRRHSDDLSRQYSSKVSNWLPIGGWPKMDA